MVSLGQECVSDNSERVTTVKSLLIVKSTLSFSHLLQMSTINLIFQMTKLRPREVKQFAQGHTVRSCRPELNLVSRLHFCLQPAGKLQQPCFYLQSHLVGDLACIVLDGKLGQWHLRLGVEWIGAMVVVALLQECVVCGLGVAGTVNGQGPGHLSLARWQILQP